MSPFATILRTTRRRRGLSLRDVASRAHVSPAAVSRWENGIHEPGATQLASLARALEVPIASLFESTASPPTLYMLRDLPVDDSLRTRVDAAISALDEALSALRDVRDAL